MAYVPNRLEVKVALDLNSNDLQDALEKLVYQAYRDGYIHGVERGGGRDHPRLDADYEDWRAFGPGYTLPGGAHYRRVVEQRGEEETSGEPDVSLINCPNCSAPWHGRRCPECGTEVRDG